MSNSGQKLYTLPNTWNSQGQPCAALHQVVQEFPWGVHQFGVLLDLRFKLVLPLNKFRTLGSDAPKQGVANLANDKEAPDP